MAKKPLTLPTKPGVDRTKILDALEKARVDVPAAEAALQAALSAYGDGQAGALLGTAEPGAVERLRCEASAARVRVEEAQAVVLGLERALERFDEEARQAHAAAVRAECIPLAESACALSRRLEQEVDAFARTFNELHGALAELSVKAAEIEPGISANFIGIVLWPAAEFHGVGIPHAHQAWMMAMQHRLHRATAGRVRWTHPIYPNAEMELSGDFSLQVSRTARGALFAIGAAAPDQRDAA